MSLHKKRILITAGPTWVALDSVRVISNIATGETGILLAEELQHLGAKVTLLLGPAGACCLNKNIRLIRFNFFNELKDKIFRELRNKKYDIVIHSAAVSDYRPVKVYAKKVKSGSKTWKINLIPTLKIVDSFRKNNSNLFLVGFKFQPHAGRKILLQKTKDLLLRANLDLAVANSIDNHGYRAYIVTCCKTYGPMSTKKDMVKKLIQLIVRQGCRRSEF